MIDITIDNFQNELILASQQQPVLLDIWAPWCGPCKQLGPLLERLEADYAGRFILAKLNSDEQPEIAGQLSQMFGVRSIPFCVLFVGGQPVDGFVGALPDAQVRAFLDKHVPSEAAVEAQAETEEAEMLAEEGDAEAALAKLEEAVATDPSNETARFDYIKLLIELDQLAPARLAFEPFASTVLINQRVAALGLWLDAADAVRTAPSIDALDSAIATNKRDFEARVQRAQRLFIDQNPTAAMEELLEILMRDKAWADGRARKLYVAILELMSKPAPKAAQAEQKGTLELTGKAAVASGDPVIDQYRRKLSMALF